MMMVDELLFSEVFRPADVTFEQSVANAIIAIFENEQFLSYTSARRPYDCAWTSQSSSPAMNIPQRPLVCFAARLRSLSKKDCQFA
jgi:hypothetical protein